MDEAAGPREHDSTGAADGATTVLREDDITRALTRIAHEIAERNGADPSLCIVGIHRRGAFLARRVRDALAGLVECELPLGDVDIGFYRDDVASRPESPIVHASHIDFDVAGRTVVVVDDVLFTGRTVRAAIEALFDYGRPARVQLAVLVDRGHRELPLRPDFVGKNLPTATSEHVQVRVRELDGVDEVTIDGVVEAAA
jgi:pyrimidine operon attenuation protein/uracil phosphoribosyltransferase